MDKVGCVCGSSFPGDFSACGRSSKGDTLYRCRCGSMYVARGGNQNDIWAATDDDCLTDEESSRGLF